ncbi:MAG: hypothetical protein WC785_00560 [Tatlockia sp.]
MADEKDDKVKQAPTPEVKDYKNEEKEEADKQRLIDDDAQKKSKEEEENKDKKEDKKEKNEDPLIQMMLDMREMMKDFNKALGSLLLDVGTLPVKAGVGAIKNAVNKAMNPAEDDEKTDEKTNEESQDKTEGLAAVKEVYNKAKNAVDNDEVFTEVVNKENQEQAESEEDIALRAKANSMLDSVAETEAAELPAGQGHAENADADSAHEDEWDDIPMKAISDTMIEPKDSANSADFSTTYESYSSEANSSPAQAAEDDDSLENSGPRLD